MRAKAKWAVIALLGAVGAFVLARSPRGASETPIELAEVIGADDVPARFRAGGRVAAEKAARAGDSPTSKVRAGREEEVEELEESVARPSAETGAAPQTAPQDENGLPIPKHMLATPEEARLLPPVPTVYGPLKVSPELARQYAEEREQRYALALDTILSREEPDPEAEVELEQKAETGLHLLKKVTEIGAPEVDCGEALCRLTFDFDSAEAQRRAYPLLRGIGLATGTEAWVKPPSKADNFELLVYVGRGGKLPITEDG